MMGCRVKASFNKFGKERLLRKRFPRKQNLLNFSKFITRSACTKGFQSSKFETKSPSLSSL